jgi:hypothetical protein
MTGRVEEPEVSRDDGEETAEVVEEAPTERVQLDEATIESEAVVERSGDYVEAEAIESAIIEVVEVQAIEHSPDGEKGLQVAEIEQGTEAVDETRPEAVEENIVEERQTEGEEGVPVIEVVQVSEISSDDDTEDAQAEAPKRIEKGVDSEQESADSGSSEGRVKEAELVPELKEEGEPGEETDSGDAGEEPEEEQDAGDKENPPNGLGSSLMDGVEKDPEDDVPPTTSDGSESEGESEGGEDWEPPEMYVHIDADGNPILVDEYGNPIASPPIVKSETGKDGSKTYTTWYPGSDTSETFVVSEYTPSLDGVYAYHHQDGSVTFVGGDGSPIHSPPKFTMDGISQKVMVGSGESAVEIPPYIPKVGGVYAYIAKDGSVSLVDFDGKQIDCPPHIDVDSVTGTVYTKGPTGQMIEILKYNPPTEGIYAYTGQDGSVTIVDEDGNQVPCPPSFDTDGTDGKVYFPGPDGSAIEIPSYTPSLDGAFAYIGQDGTLKIVDEYGQLIDCPPHVDLDPLKGDVYTMGADGSALKIPPYDPMQDDIYIHIAQDGYVSVVGSNGYMVDCPPHIKKVVDAKGDVHYYAEYPGSKTVELKNYKPVYTKPFKK